jgi:sugar phosphate isomerase/epimerase
MRIIKHITVIIISLSILLGCIVPESNANNMEKISVNISVQLWSVRDDLKSNFKGTLTELSNMGFTGVEFAGVFGPFKEDPAGLKSYLASLGLKASGAHVSIEQFSEENFDKTVSFYKDLGVNFLIIPWEERAWNADKIDELIVELNTATKKLAIHGLQTGFHNHDTEFEAYQHATFWDHIAKSTEHDFILQLDIGWVTFAGKDPVSYINRYPGRTLTTHIKATLPKNVTDKRPIIGEDFTDWQAVIKAGLEVGGTQWFVLEQDEYPDGLTPLEAVKISKKGFDNIIAAIQ